MQAIWNGQILAVSDDTVVVENNHYFPPQSLNMAYFSASSKQTHCPWKGEASYYHINVDGRQNPDAAWYYPEPKPAAREIQGKVAFWRGVQVLA